MLTPSDPLFWLIAVGLTFPWGCVAWLAVSRGERDARIDALKADLQTAIRKWNDAQLKLLARGPEPLVAEDGAKVIPFEPRVIEGGLGGKHRRPNVVDLPLKGPIS